MNREQAENILEAYINMECGGGDNKARQSLREVILDAMTEYRVKSNYPSITYPYTTWVDATKLPTNWDDTPKVTCTGLTVNGMEVFKAHHDSEVRAVDE